MLDIDKIRADIRVTIDQNLSNESLIADNDSVSLDEIIAQKIGDAKWWLNGCNGFSAESGDDIPQELYSAFVYYAAYLVLVTYGDERAQELKRTSNTLLKLNVRRAASLHDEAASSNVIGDIVEDFDGEGDEENVSLSVGGMIPQNFGRAKVVTIEL